MTKDATLLLEYRPPYDWGWFLGFLSTRAIPGIEAVGDGSYTRSHRTGSHAGWFSVRAAPRGRHGLRVTISAPLVPVQASVLAAVRRMFDLDAEPEALRQHFDADDILGPLVRARPGLRLPGAADGFELAVRGVIGQQISVAGARTIAGRVHAAFGEHIDGPPGITHLPTTVEALAAADPAAVSALGMPLSRGRTLVLLAQSVAAGDISFAPTADMEGAMEALLRVPGIGPWTAEYIAMRGYQSPDAFPATDLGIRHALPGLNPAQRAEAWRPWRAYAAIHLWQSLATKATV